MPQPDVLQSSIKRKPYKSPHPGKIDPAAVEDPSMLKAIILLRQALEKQERTAGKTRRPFTEGLNNQDCAIDEAVIRILREHALLDPVLTAQTSSSKD